VVIAQHGVLLLWLHPVRPSTSVPRACRRCPGLSLGQPQVITHVSCTGDRGDDAEDVILDV
jgi:hypothetical protein